MEICYKTCIDFTFTIANIYRVWVTVYHNSSIMFEVNRTLNDPKTSSPLFSYVKYFLELSATKLWKTRSSSGLWKWRYTKLYLDNYLYNIIKDGYYRCLWHQKMLTTISDIATPNLIYYLANFIPYLLIKCFPLECDMGPNFIIKRDHFSFHE